MPSMPGPLRLRTKEDNLTLLERLKKLEKKDWAAVGVCLLLLGVLPVVEHLLMRPTDEGILQPGWAVPGADGEGGDLYESGVGPGAPGGVPGQASGEVITPLAGRDPSSLVMGLGGPAKKPEAPSGPSATEQRLRDALAEAARRSVPAANNAAGLPKPTAKLSTTLANFASLPGAGGSGATGGGLKGADGAALASAKGVPGKPGERPSSFAGAGAMPGFKGVGQRSVSEASSGELERLKAQADKQAAAFNRANAAQALDEAAKASPDIDGKTDGSGYGAGLSQDAKAADAAGKVGANPGDRQSRNFGASLEQQKLMARFNKELEACWSAKAKVQESIFGGNINCDNPENFKGDFRTSGLYQAFSKGVGEEIIGKTLVGGFMNDWVKHGLDKISPPEKGGICVSYVPTGVLKRALIRTEGKVGGLEVVRFCQGDEARQRPKKLETGLGDIIGSGCVGNVKCDKEDEKPTKEDVKEVTPETIPDSDHRRKLNQKPADPDKPVTADCEAKAKATDALSNAAEAKVAAWTAHLDKGTQESRELELAVYDKFRETCHDYLMDSYKGAFLAAAADQAKLGNTKYSAWYGQRAKNVDQEWKPNTDEIGICRRGLGPLIGSKNVAGQAGTLEVKVAFPFYEYTGTEAIVQSREKTAKAEAILTSGGGIWKCPRGQHTIAQVEKYIEPHRQLQEKQTEMLAVRTKCETGVRESLQLKSHDPECLKQGRYALVDGGTTLKAACAMQ